MLALAAGCGSEQQDDTITASRAPRKGPTIAIGSFNFPESQLLAEAYGQKLVADGFAVSQRLNLGPRQVVEPALTSGQIDFIPEYLGAVLAYVTKNPAAATDDVQEMYRELVRAYAKDDITVLRPSRARDDQGYAVTRQIADRYGVRSLEDLKPLAPGWVLGGPPECPVVPECLPGLKKAYGLEFKEFRPLDASGPLTVLAMQGGQIQVGVMFTTSGFIPGAHLVELVDPKHLASAQNVVPVVRQEIVDAYGDALARSVDAVSRRLTTEALAKLNKRIAVDHEDPRAVAARWLRAEGLAK